jgi:hypothetical protein
VESGRTGFSHERLKEIYMLNIKRLKVARAPSSLFNLYFVMYTISITAGGMRDSIKIVPLTTPCNPPKPIMRPPIMGEIMKHIKPVNVISFVYGFNDRVVGNVKPNRVSPKYTVPIPIVSNGIDGT